MIHSASQGVAGQQSPEQRQRKRRLHPELRGNDIQLGLNQEERRHLLRELSTEEVRRAPAGRGVRATQQPWGGRARPIPPPLPLAALGATQKATQTVVTPSPLRGRVPHCCCFCRCRSRLLLPVPLDNAEGTATHTHTRCRQRGCASHGPPK
ncbi:uncharacterized protein Tco025E_06905 [Trypanosoma conorhini]|uniref:Uncharacterized protein n=1 Tax=Trypanosoma conorhini TaxID=83891 RepID=A0A422NX15_9TRYP|nr:uncharacterized protein Tco025E_06905 [Trypanosoma conorhini]RNF10073.1 hypothetical protein Tco025E_06905 [Trypanosoma conorhini]